MFQKIPLKPLPLSCKRGRLWPFSPTLRSRVNSTMNSAMNSASLPCGFCTSAILGPAVAHACCPVFVSPTVVALFLCFLRCFDRVGRPEASSPPPEPIGFLAATACSFARRSPRPPSVLALGSDPAPVECLSTPRLLRCPLLCGIGSLLRW